MPSFNAFAAEKKRRINASKTFSERQPAIPQAREVPEIVTSSLSAPQMIGMSGHTDRELQRLLSKIEFVVHVPATLLPSIAIFTFLKTVRRYPIRLNWEFCAGREVVQSAQHHPQPAACILPLGSSAMLVRDLSGEYRPLLPMPGASHAIAVAPTKISKVDTVYLVRDRPSSSSVFCYELFEQKKLNSRRCQLLHMEPEEMSRLTAKPVREVGLCQWFPMHVFSTALMGFQSGIRSDSDTAGTSVILFIHQSHSKQGELSMLLEVAIRDAWLCLMEDPELLRQTILNIMDGQYMKFLGRAAGLHYANLS